MGKSNDSILEGFPGMGTNCLYIMEKVYTSYWVLAGKYFTFIITGIPILKIILFQRLKL
jgi:hypothetical protein